MLADPVRFHLRVNQPASSVQRCQQQVFSKRLLIPRGKGCLFFGKSSQVVQSFHHACNVKTFKCCLSTMMAPNINLWHLCFSQTLENLLLNKCCSRGWRPILHVASTSLCRVALDSGLGKDQFHWSSARWGSLNPHLWGLENIHWACQVWELFTQPKWLRRTGCWSLWFYCWSNVGATTYMLFWGIPSGHGFGQQSQLSFWSIHPLFSTGGTIICGMLISMHVNMRAWGQNQQGKKLPFLSCNPWPKVAVRTMCMLHMVLHGMDTNGLLMPARKQNIRFSCANGCQQFWQSFSSCLRN